MKSIECYLIIYNFTISHMGNFVCWDGTKHFVLVIFFLLLCKFVFFLSNTLKDTFNAFDKDGSGEMGFAEYTEAWKFLGRGGSEEEIQ